MTQSKKDSGSIDLTGGPVWHLRALSRRRRLWKPFRDEIESWLSDWSIRSRELLLVGPSAGWCLPEQYLRNFSVIHAIDPDPLAALLFRFVHPRAHLGEWIRGDFFVEGDNFLHRHASSAVLFCNMLGQRRYVNRDVALVEEEMRMVKMQLRGRNWASFHDLVSGDGIAEQPVKELKTTLDQASILSSLDLSGEWLDHLTSDVFPRTVSRKIIPWQFARGRLHLVEAGFVNA